MTPILALWPSAHTAPTAEAVGDALAAAGFGPDRYRSAAIGGMDTDALRNLLHETHREIVPMTALDTTLHTVVVVPLFDSEAVECTRRVLEAAATAGVTCSVEVLALKPDLAAPLGTTAPEGSTDSETKLSHAVATAPCLASYATIDNYLSTNAPVNFSAETFARFLYSFLRLLIEHFGMIFQASVYANRNQTLSFGMSVLSFPREQLVGYLLNRAFAAAIEKERVTEEETIDINMAQQAAAGVLQDIEKVYAHFLHEQVERPLQVGDKSKEQIAADMSVAADALQQAWESRLAALINDPAMNLPTKEATLAIVLGVDSEMLRGIGYATSETIDAGIRPALDLYVDTVAGALRDGHTDAEGLLPVRRQFPSLCFHEDTDENGDIIPNPANDRPFNPLEQIKDVRSRMLDLAAWLRGAEKRIAELRQAAEAEQLGRRAVLKEGELSIGTFHPTGAVAETPLAEKYVPAPGLKIPPSVDLRRYLPPARNQGALGSCSAFATVAMYEALANRFRPEGMPPLAISEGFLFYHTNAARGALDEGSNFAEQLGVLSEKGSCDPALYPYDAANPAIQPTEAATAEAMNHRALKALQLPLASEGHDKMGAMEANHRIITSALAEGYAVGISLKVLDSFGRAEGGFVSRPTQAELDAETPGNHAMTITGYSEDGQYYIVRNSWSTAFGDEGYAYVSAAYIDDPALNNYCCIITHATDLEGNNIKAKPLPSVAAIAGTQNRIRLFTLGNEIEYARLRLAALTSVYHDLFSYYSTLHTRLTVPSVRKAIVALAENRLSMQRADLLRRAGELRDEMPEKLKQLRRNYKKKLFWSTLVSVVDVAAMFFYTYHLQKWTWWVHGTTIIVVALTVMLWLYYSYYKRKIRAEMRAEIEELEARAGEIARKMDRTRLDFQAADHIFDIFSGLKLRYDSRYTHLQNFNRNLAEWHSEALEEAAEVEFENDSMFVTLIDRAALDRFFDKCIGAVVADIHLVDAFRDYDINAEAMGAARQKLLDTAAAAIKALLERYGVCNHIDGERLPFDAGCGIDAVMLDLNRRAAALTRSPRAGLRESRFVVFPHRAQDSGQWLRTLAPHFSVTPVVVPGTRPDAFIILTLASRDKPA